MSVGVRKPMRKWRWSGEKNIGGEAEGLLNLPFTASSPYPVNPAGPMAVSPVDGNNDFGF